jgi:hypothetical protein
MPARRTIVHVNLNVIRSNLRHGKRDAPISVRRGREVVRTMGATIYGQDGKVAAEVVYSPDAPLSCGARVWIEVIGEASVVPVSTDLATDERESSVWP